MFSRPSFAALTTVAAPGAVGRCVHGVGGMVVALVAESVEVHGRSGIEEEIKVQGIR